MKISKMVVKNYRTVFDIELEISPFSIFVGQNNHGKTNIFEAVNWFFNQAPRGERIDDIKHRSHQDEEMLVELHFVEAQEGLNAMQAEGNRESIRKLIGESDEVIIRRRASDPKKRFIVVDGDEKPSPTGFDRALNDFLPSFEYVNTRTYHEDYVKYGKNSPIAMMLSGVLGKILENDPEYQEFKNKFDSLFGADTSTIRAELDALSNKVKIYLEKQFPECTKVEFEVSSPQFEDLLKNFNTTIDDGISTSVDEKGDGLQRAVMLAILQTFADYRKQNDIGGKNFIYLIDEAELHLHPSGQRKLKLALEELISTGDQVFISTHSSVFVSDVFEKQSIYSVEKVNHTTDISPISETQKPHVIFELLGGSPADILLPSNFLIVEGHSDHKFIETVIERFYTDKPIIQIVAASGDFEKEARSFDSINAAYVPIGVSSPVYKEKAVILHDKVNQSRQSDYAKFKSKYSHLDKNGQLFEQPHESIEECYPSPWVKTSTQVKNMGHEDKQILAKEAGESISQEDFEGKMSTIFKALDATWQKSYS